MPLVASIKNNGGFTLVEVMIAILIMVVGMLGLLQAINVSLEHNLRNQVREEAVYVGEKYMNDLKGKGFDNIFASYSALTVPSAIRGVGRSYTVERSATNLASDSIGPTTKQLEVVVKWTYKNVQFQNRVVAPISVLRN